AGYAYPLFHAVELIQSVQVTDQHIANFGYQWRRKSGTGSEVVRNLAEDPWPALRGAADHHAVGAGSAENGACVLRGADVAIRDHRDGYRSLDLGNGVVLGMPGESTGAG